MKIQAVNIYQSKNLIQKQITFGDFTDIGGCEPSTYEIRMSSLEDSYRRRRWQIEDYRLDAIKKWGKDAAKEYDEQLVELKAWFLSQKQALKEEYGLVAKKVEKPSFFKRLFQIK